MRAAYIDITPGARPIALGGAFVAVADDSSAVIYNAAGLSQIDAPEICFSSSKLFGLSDLSSEGLVFTVPENKIGAWGLGIHALGSFSYYFEGMAALAFSKKIIQNKKFSLNIGSTLKYFFRTYRKANSNIQNSAAGLDPGVLFELRQISLGKKIELYPNFGAVVRIFYEDGNWSYQASPGLSLSFLPFANLSYDYNISAGEHNMGLEAYVVHDFLSLRAGVRDLSGNQSAALGAGIRIKRCTLDYTFQPGGNDIPATHSLSLTAGL